jgi:hypothetical protein
MSDETTFNTRHVDSHRGASDDPVVKMLAEHKRLYSLAGRARTAALEIVSRLPENVQRLRVTVDFPDGSFSYIAESDLQRSMDVRVKLEEALAKLAKCRGDTDHDYVCEWSERAIQQFREGKSAIKAAREASGCEALYREEEQLHDQATEVRNRIVETQATSLAGVLAQLELFKEELLQDTHSFDFIDTIAAGIKRLAEGEKASEPEIIGFGEPEPRA